jgi:hypothetical protein
MSFRFMSGTQGMQAARVCASPASFRLPSEARPIRFGRFLDVRAKPNLAVSTGFSAIGAKGKTARVRDPFSRPVCSSAREPRNTTFAGRYEIETPLIWINASWAEAIYTLFSLLSCQELHWCSKMLERGLSRRGRKFRPRCGLWSCGFQRKGWVLRALPVIAFD